MSSISYGLLDDLAAASLTACSLSVIFHIEFKQRKRAVSTVSVRVPEANGVVRERDHRLIEELSDARALQRLSSELIPEKQSDVLYEKALDTAIELLKADAASLQILDPATSQLHLVASRNLDPKSQEYWQTTSYLSVSSCGKVLKDHERIMVPDVEIDECFAGTQELEEYRRSKIRGCQSTPLISRSGRLLGMISTHWTQPHLLRERDFVLFDVLARQIADLIERTQTEQQLARVAEDSGRWQRLYEAVLRGTPDLGYVFDLNHRFTYANEALLKMWGKTWGEAIGKNCLELGYPEWHAAMHDREIEEVIATKEPIRGEVPFTGPLGTRIYDYIFFPVLGSDGEVEAIGGTTRDITELKETEVALRENEERFRSFFEQGVEGVAQTDLTGRFTMVNDCYCRIVGRSREELLTMNKLDLTAQEDLEESTRLFYALASGTGPNFIIEKRYVRPDGSYVWVRNHISAIRSRPGGLPERLMTVTTDITEQKRAQLALKESEERFRVIVENVREYALVQTDASYRIISWNPGAERMFGYTAKEIEGQSFDFLLTTEDRQAEILAHELAAVEETGRNEDARWFVRRDGARIWTRWVTEPIRDEDGKVIALTKVLRDETERQKIETSMRQSEKLAVVGRLASSIAHEINNPLEAVTNLVYLARQNSTLTVAQEYLDMAEHELKRMSHITTETLRFHRQSTKSAKTDMVEILESVLLLHEGRLRSAQITTERRYAPHPAVMCRSDEIRQVLANLIGNAIDAMVKDGERHLRVRVRRGFDTVAGEGVQVLISDTGSGISKQSRKHLFEPFFTTKAATGTGLGLWVSAEIVKKHHGRLRFRSRVSQPHRGTVFSLFLSSGAGDEKTE